MGKVTVDAERVTQPEMAAVGAKAGSPPDDQLARRTTVRGETKWFSTPPPGPMAPPPPGLSSSPSSSRSRRAISDRPASGALPVSTQPPSTTPTSARVSSRVPIRVDDVASAVRHGRNALDLLRRTVPRVLRSRSELASAPIDHREGFVLSLIDGTTSVQALLDVGGMPDEDVLAALQRLRRLGIITLG